MVLARIKGCPARFTISDQTAKECDEHIGEPVSVPPLGKLWVKDIEWDIMRQEPIVVIFQGLAIDTKTNTTQTNKQKNCRLIIN
jgi:hypothetical protein